MYDETQIILLTTREQLLHCFSNANVDHKFFRLGYIIITSICAKINWLTLAGHCPWTILLRMIMEIGCV